MAEIRQVRLLDLAVLACLGAGCTARVVESSLGAPVEFVRVEVVPHNVTLESGATQKFIATAYLSDSSVQRASVTWSKTGGGSLTQDGLYAAPAQGDFLVIATLAGSVFADTALVTVLPPAAPTPVRVEITPPSATVMAGGTLSFLAQLRLSDSSLTAASVVWTTSGGGTITGGGVYTAPATAGATRVIATLSGGALADTAFVTVTATPPPAPTLVRIDVNPGAVSLDPGQTQNFTATGRMSDSTTRAVTVTWTAPGATITSGGLYTAASTPGVYLAIGRVSGGTLRDTATITVLDTTSSTPPPPVSGDVPELPSGYDLRAVHSGATLVPSGWITNSDGTRGISVVDDSDAPASPLQVMRVNYPASMRDGSAPVGLEFGGTNGANRLFYTYWFRYNSTFQGHDSQVNKHLFVFGASGSVIVYSEMRFVGNVTQGTIDFQFQGGMAAPTYDKRLVESFGGNRLKINKDRWHRVSLELIYGSNSTGIVRAWVDGTKVGEITNANFATRIGVVKVDPTWGGNSGDVMTQAGFLYFDEIRLYTK